jgi:hypothetical protein
MKTLIIGAQGLLGAALMKDGRLGERIGTSRRGTEGYIPFSLECGALLPACDLAFLCAGTKGFAQCEGNRAAFLADVDGNIAVARFLMSVGAFVVFVSSDAVEVLGHTAYGRNREMVEAALVMQPLAGIFRPGKFDSASVHECALACADVGLYRRQGITRWPLPSV